MTFGSPPARPAVLSVTDRAKAQIRTLLAQRGKPSLGIRIGVKTRGCSGLSYTLEFADALFPHDEDVIVDEFHIVIDPKAILFLIGAVMDFEETKISSGFVFQNPNEKGKCGCGESFHV